MGPEVKRARALLKASETVVIISHERPDGDAVGSLLALTLSLELMGKKAIPVLVDGIPARFEFLPGSGRVVKAPPEGPFALVAVDCSDLPRTGLGNSNPDRRPDLNIDHHATNTLFGAINLLDTSRAATSELLFELSRPLGLPLNADVATDLLAGIVTDTIGFRTANTSPRVLRTAAALMELGADLTDIYEKSLSQHSFSAARYWGQGLTQLERDDGLIWATLTLQDRARAEYPGRDDADLINFLATIEQTAIAIVFIEQSSDRVKVSWRSRPGTDVARLAKRFGGGGHEQAAGAIVDGSLDRVKADVLAATKLLLQGVEEPGP